MHNGRNRFHQDGFTLIELMVVVVIIAILAAIAIIKQGKTREDAYLATMKADLRNLLSAEESFFADSARYTTSLPPNYYTSGDVTGPTITVSGQNITAWVGNSHTTRTCAIFIGTTSLAPATREGEPRCT